MKKTLTTLLIFALFSTTKAQVTLEVKRLKPDSFKLEKGSKLIHAEKDTINNTYQLVYGKPECDVTRSAWTGSSTYRGLKWSIKNVYLNSNFEYNKTESKIYASSEAALLDNQYVFGKTYKPRSLKIIGGAGISKPLNNAFMFTNIITPTATFTGFKINNSFITCSPIVNETKYNGTLCGEEPVAVNISNDDAKEEKGQRWIPIYNNPVPNGGNILFNTVGVIKEEKNHFVFRSYDDKGNAIKEQTLTFDNQSLVTVKEFEKTPGVFDYYFIITPINYKKSKQPASAANQYEIIKIDGVSLEIKYRVKVEAPMSRWRVDQVIVDNKEVYIYGQCADNKEDYDDFKPYNYKNYKGFMVAKINDGKLEYINGYNLKDANAALKVVQGVKGKVIPSFIFTYYRPYVRNGKLFLVGQIANSYGKSGPELGAVATMIFDKNGKLEAFLARAESKYTVPLLHFSKDGNTMYWSCLDYANYNKLTDNYGSMQSKHKFGVMSGLNMVKYNVSTMDLGIFQSFKDEEWALYYDGPILFENEEEIVFKGFKLTKKIKEAEMIFITLKK